MIQQQSKSLLLPILEFIFLFVIVDNIASYYWISAHFTSQLGVDNGGMLLTGLDQAIPFTLIFFPFYTSEYLIVEMLLLTTVIFTNFNPECSRKLFCGVLFIELTATMLFFLFPASFLPLLENAGEPKIELFNHLFSHFSSFILPSFNSFPSLHVAIGWCVIRFFNYYFPEGKAKRIMLIFLMIWFVCMTLSTLTLKYHYILDDIAGLVLGEIAYWLIIVKNICRVERWNEVLSPKKLVFFEFSLMILTTVILYSAYPNYMMLGK